MLQTLQQIVGTLTALVITLSGQLGGQLNEVAQSINPNTQLAQVSGITSGAIKTGGLTALPSSTLGPNLLSNPDFETTDGAGWTSSWTTFGSAVYSVDSTVSHSGSRSMKMTNPKQSNTVERVDQRVDLKGGGLYTLRGWVKTDFVTSSDTQGLIVGLFTGRSYTYGGARTSAFQGTNDWTYFEIKSIAISQDTNARVSISSFHEADSGMAWVDGLELREEIPASTMDIFMLYPNYRGILFDDQSQTLKFDISIAPPSSGSLSDFEVFGEVIDESTNAAVLSSTFAATANFVATFSGSSLQNDKTYLARFTLKRKSDGSTASVYPDYRISKLAGSLRSQMTVWFDEHNRIIINGKPTFLIGVWDHGMQYYASEASFESNLQNSRRLWDLPINWHVNYGYGRARSSSMKLYYNVLQRHNILGVGIAHCHKSVTSAKNDGGLQWFQKATDADVIDRANHPNFLGFYTMDECGNTLVSSAFDDYQRIKRMDPDGLTFMASDKPNGLHLWRDSVDLLGMDPYPLNIIGYVDIVAPQGFKLNHVANWAEITRNAVKNARPFTSILQYFQLYAGGRWPTEKELRDMSYMAIAEGANGVGYWSIGTNALAHVCNGRTPERTNPAGSFWCPFRVEQFNNLKNVVTELSSLQAVLASIDQPSLLSSKSNSNIRTRVKYENGKGYLIASNYENTPQSATFTWASAPTGVAVYNEGRNLTASGKTFTDSFAPYEAHVYEIYSSGVPPTPTPTPTPTPPIAGVQRRIVIAPEGISGSKIASGILAFINRTTGAVVNQMNFTTNSGGEYTFTIPANLPSSVGIRISVPGYLPRLITNADLTSSSLLTINVPELPSGDFNGDGVINSLDFSLMSRKWNQVSNIALHDINKDGIVNSLDYALLSKNWLRRGE